VNRSRTVARQSSSSREKAAAAQESLNLETYTENAKINKIRRHVDVWRAIPNPTESPSPMRGRITRMLRICSSTMVILLTISPYFDAM
jgi:hypothetical protein